MLGVRDVASLHSELRFGNIVVVFTRLVRAIRGDETVRLGYFTDESDDSGGWNIVVNGVLQDENASLVGGSKSDFRAQLKVAKVQGVFPGEFDD